MVVGGVLEVLSKLNRLFRPAWPGQSYLAVLTTGLRWNGGRYAALPGPLGQHAGCGGPGHQDLDRSPVFYEA